MGLMAKSKFHILCDPIEYNQHLIWFKITQDKQPIDFVFYFRK